MKIAVACDHGGLRLKNVLIEEMKKQGYEVVDFGTYNEESCDYPDYASKAAKAVALGECEKGVVVCGTGMLLNFIDEGVIKYQPKNVVLMIGTNDLGNNF